MPLYAVALMLSGAALIGVLRILTWILRAIGYRANPRPGLIDLTRSTTLAPDKEKAS